MQSISSLLKKYKITIKEFAVLYVQIVGKAYQDNVNQISDTYYKRIESLLKQQSPKPAKKSTKSSSVEKSPKKSEKSAFSPAKKLPKDTKNSIQANSVKTIQAVDLQDDFLAWLWFDVVSSKTVSVKPTDSTPTKKSKTSKKTKNDLSDTSSHSSTADPVVSDTTLLNPFSSGFGNAMVVRSDPAKPHFTQAPHRWSSQKSQSRPTTSPYTRPNPNTRPNTRPKQRWNIEFLQTNYKSKEHQTKEYKRISPEPPKPDIVPKIQDRFVPKTSDHQSGSQTSRFAHKWIKIDYSKSGTTKISNNFTIQQGKYRHPSSKSVILKTQTPKTTKEAKTSDTLVKKTEVIIGDSITVKEFSEKIGIPVADIIKKMLANKILGGINTSLDFDTVSLIAAEFDVLCTKQVGAIDVKDIVGGNIQKLMESDKDSTHAITRPPIITVMGHVDHGKTKLLDYIRKTNIMSGEAWGITQSIGASQIVHNGQKITFIDTPGHQLFTSLRSRGAKLTDVCIIVIAADDGVKPQTIEAISHAKDSGAPIIVAITKIDKWVDNTELIKSQMVEHELIPEDRWGSVPIVKVSAVTGQGIDQLLDQILFQVEVLDLKYDPSKSGLWVVLESTKDAKQGVMTTAIIMSGTIRVGDVFVVHNIVGKIKRMIDSHGKNTHSASWWDPVKIYGMSQVPEPGRILEVVENEKIAHHRVNQIMASLSKESSNLQSLLTRIAQWDNVQLKLILKADGFGSLEALKYSMTTIPMPENIQIKIVHSDVGNFSDSDIELAKAADAIMLWFNLDLNANLKKKADQMKLTMRSFHIIYEIMDYVEQLALGMVKHEAKEVYVGKLDVLQVFFRKWSEMIIWGRVVDGEIRNGAFFKTWRNEQEFGSGKVTSLQKWQESVSTIGTGYECGMKVKVDKKIEAGDQLEYFVME